MLKWNYRFFKIKRFSFIILIGLISSSFIYGEENNTSSDIDVTIGVDNEANQKGEESEKKLSPKGFGSIELGAEYQSVLDLLSNSPNFRYRKSDLSWNGDSATIAADGRGFVKKGFFQFFEDRLYSIIIILDKNKMDYYSVFNQLTQRYGKFKSLSPTRVLWDSETVKLSLERPLTIRYLDKGIHQQFINGSSIKKSKEQVGREDFLDSF